MKDSGQINAPAASLPEDRKLGSPHSQSRRFKEEKYFLTLPGIELRIFKPIA
jgi:hypothetical protein